MLRGSEAGRGVGECLVDRHPLPPRGPEGDDGKLGIRIVAAAACGRIKDARLHGPLSLEFCEQPANFPGQFGAAAREMRAGLRYLAVGFQFSLALGQGPELAHLLLGELGTLVAPAPQGVLAAQQTHAQGLNDRHVRRIAEAVKEEKGQGQGVGGMQVVDIGPDLAQICCRVLHRRVGRGHIAFQERQAYESRRAGAGGRPATIGALQTAQMSNAAADSLLDCLVLRGRNRRGSYHDRAENKEGSTERPGHGSNPPPAM